MVDEKIRVLIIDDHDIVRQGLIVLLENFDEFEVVGDVSDARRGLEICAERCPDVVLMDMVMPMMDGITATRLVREKCSTTQVIALTSFNDEENIQKALKAGAISYLMKNVSVDELANAVRKAARGQATLAPEAAQVLIAAATRPPSVGHET